MTANIILRFYHLITYDRNGNKIFDFEVTTGRSSSDCKKFAGGIKRKYKINILCTDGNFAYQKITISHRYIISKSEKSF